jgi:anti-anti-sigma regulatory factor
VVSLTGAVAAEDTIVLQKCLEEVSQDPPKYLILNLGAVTSISKDMLRPFTILQQSVRERSKLFVCNGNAELMKVLRQDGVVREAEVQPDLLQTLKTILIEESK